MVDRISGIHSERFSASDRTSGLYSMRNFPVDIVCQDPSLAAAWASTDLLLTLVDGPLVFCRGFASQWGR